MVDAEPNISICNIAPVVEKDVQVVENICWAILESIEVMQIKGMSLRMIELIIAQ